MADPAENQTETLNPWFSIWLSPRATIKQTLTHPPSPYFLILLAGLYGITYAIGKAASRGIADHHSLGIILASCFILGPISSILWIYVYGFVIRLTGQWLDGKASYRSTITAISYAYIPAIWALPLMLSQFALLGPPYFYSELPNYLSDEGLLLLSSGLMGIAEAILCLWGFFSFIFVLSEVQSFSAWRALGNILLAAMLILIGLISLTTLGTIVLAIFARI